jgi:hypothetical protein
MSIRHCEEPTGPARSGRPDDKLRDEAIPHPNPPPLAGEGREGALDRLASLAMTIMRLVSALALAFVAVGQATAQEFSDPYSIMAPERVPARHHVHKSPMRTRHLPPSGEKTAAKHSGHEYTVIAHGSSGVVLPTPLPRTQLIPPEGGGTPLVRPAPLQQGVTVLPGANNPIPNLPHGPETFQDRASRCAFQQQLYNVPGNLGTQYMGSCVQ